MIKKLLLSLVLSCLGLTASFAIVTTTDNSGINTPNAEILVEDAVATPVTILENIKSDLESKAATSGLSKKEKRMLRKVNRKIKKWNKRIAEGKDRKWIAAVLISFFLGGLGIDRFYLGYPIAGVFKLLTLGGLGLWALVDFILILLRELKPKGGDYYD